MTKKDKREYQYLVIYSIDWNKELEYFETFDEVKEFISTRFHDEGQAIESIQAIIKIEKFITELDIKTKINNPEVDDHD